MYSKVTTTPWSEEVIAEKKEKDELKVEQLLIHAQPELDFARSISSIEKKLKYCQKDLGWGKIILSLMSSKRKISKIREKFRSGEAEISIERCRIPMATDTTGNDTIKMIIVGDFGVKDCPHLGYAGVRSEIQNLVNDDIIHYTIHLGDVYYSGTKKEEQVFESSWVKGQIGSFTLNSNHEMYSAAKYYRSVLLHSPKFSLQNQSHCFLLENADWLVLGLDSAALSSFRSFFGDGRIKDPAQISLLQYIACPSKSHKKVIIMTHHNPIYFNGKSTTKLWDDVVNSKWGIGREPNYWYFGHEHNAIAYKRGIAGTHLTRFRCSGHGAIPFRNADEFNGLSTIYWRETKVAQSQLLPERLRNGFITFTLQADKMIEERFIDEFGQSTYLPTSYDHSSPSLLLFSSSSLPSSDLPSDLYIHSSTPSPPFSPHHPSTHTTSTSAPSTLTSIPNSSHPSKSSPSSSDHHHHHHSNNNNSNTTDSGSGSGSGGSGKQQQQQHHHHHTTSLMDSQQKIEKSIANWLGSSKSDDHPPPSSSSSVYKKKKQTAAADNNNHHLSHPITSTPISSSSTTPKDTSSLLHSNYHTNTIPPTNTTPTPHSTTSTTTTASGGISSPPIINPTPTTSTKTSLLSVVRGHKRSKSHDVTKAELLSSSSSSSPVNNNAIQSTDLSLLPSPTTTPNTSTSTSSSTTSTITHSGLFSRYSSKMSLGKKQKQPPPPSTSTSSQPQPQSTISISEDAFKRNVRAGGGSTIGGGGGGGGVGGVGGVGGLGKPSYSELWEMYHLEKQKVIKLENELKYLQSLLNPSNISTYSLPPPLPHTYTSTSNNNNNNDNANNDNANNNINYAAASAVANNHHVHSSSEPNFTLSISHHDAGDDSKHVNSSNNNTNDNDDSYNDGSNNDGDSNNTSIEDYTTTSTIEDNTDTHNTNDDVDDDNDEGDDDEGEDDEQHSSPLRKIMK